MKKYEVVMMAYREDELTALLEKDVQHPDLLFTKEYISSGGVTADTGKTYEETVLSWLLAHGDALVHRDTNWSMYRTVVEKASLGQSRLMAGILGQKEFAGGLALDMSVRLKDSRAEEWGRFAFASMDKNGKILTLYDMKPAVEKEQPLRKMLRLWSWKESVNPMTVAQALGRKAPFALKAVSLVTGASNDRYGLQERKGLSLNLQRLGILLGVSIRYLFHGFYLSPVNPGLSLYGQYTRAELLSKVEKDSTHPESLYQKDYVNRVGVTSDTGEPYSKVLGEWLIEHRDIWMTLPRGLYRRVEGARAERSMKNDLFSQVRKQKVLPPYGKVLLEDILFLGSRFQQIGRPVMVLHDASGEGASAYSMVRLLEIPESSDALLGAVLRAFTHLAVLEQDKLLQEMKLPAYSHIESRILLEKGRGQTDGFLRDLPYLSSLMKAMGIGLALVEDGYEALW
ncbi:hypothetical protein [Dialister sp.]|uniref:hypothetical protein n=1 Tax=Dialister sp. TaxID=1955814 RepID=UPI003F0D7480